MEMFCKQVLYSQLEKNLKEVELGFVADLYAKYQEISAEIQIVVESVIN
jgi:hypothetical protein